MSEKLYRARRNKIISGVCAGLGDYLNVDPVIVRIIFIIFAFIHGLGLLVYIIMWIIVPEEPIENLYPNENDLFSDDFDNPINAEFNAEIDQKKSNSKTVLGIILILLGFVFLADRFLPYFDFDFFLPVTLIIIGAVLLFNSIKK
ncbi:DNA-binding transcriptional activator PspC [bacterium BMS3Abin04]|nr:DNA-binding transcriptional activator PspC [bacterium BMS3Abin04]